MVRRILKPLKNPKNKVVIKHLSKFCPRIQMEVKILQLLGVQMPLIKQKSLLIKGTQQNFRIILTQIKVQKLTLKFIMMRTNKETDEDDSEELTSGWLLSETIRHFNSHIESSQISSQFKNLVPVALTTKDNQRECIDYYLTQMHEPLIRFLRFNYDGASDQILADQVLKIYFANKDELDRYYQKQRKSLKEIPSLRDYDLIKVLGTGGFSQVLMVRKRVTGKLYAMKVINKKHILDSNKVDQIISERKIFSMLNHPFIVQLYCAFTSKNNLYLVLDLCTGGELFYYISNLRRFTEKQAKTAFSEILLTIEYLHENNILYRDLKPENILIDEKGHIKLTDFGLSKMNFTEEDLSQTFCGSPEYMSPEMLTQRGHNFKLDIYCLGVLLYELLAGIPPHYNQDRIKMYQDIVNKRERFPRTMSRAAINLLQKMLEKDPQKRISIEEIKQHEFCNDIDWESLMEKKLEPPINVNIHHSNFEKEYTEMKINIDVEAEEDNFMNGGILNNCSSIKNKLRKTKSSQYLHSQERVASEQSKERKIKPKRMITTKNIKQFNQPNFILQNMQIQKAPDEPLETEQQDFTSEVKTKLALIHDLQNQDDEIIRQAFVQRKLLERQITPTFQEFIYRRQTNNKLPLFEKSQPTLESPNGNDKSRTSFAFKILPDDQIEMFNINSNNPSILTEHADNLKFNIQNLQSFDHVSKNLTYYHNLPLPFKTKSNYIHPTKQENSLSQKLKQIPDENSFLHYKEAIESIIEEEFCQQSVSSYNSDDMDNDLRIQMEEIENLFGVDRIATAKSQDNSPKFAKLSRKVSKLFDEKYQWQKPTETQEEVNIDDSQLIRRKSLKNMTPIISEQKGYHQIPYHNHRIIQKHFTQLHVDNHNKIQEIRELLNQSTSKVVDSQELAIKRRQSANLLMLSEKLHGVISERKRLEVPIPDIFTINEEEQSSNMNSNDNSSQFGFQPNKKQSTNKIQAKHSHNKSSSSKKKVEKTNTAIISQFTQQEQIEIISDTKQPRSPIRKLKSQESFATMNQLSETKKRSGSRKQKSAIANYEIQLNQPSVSNGASVKVQQFGQAASIYSINSQKQVQSELNKTTSKVEQRLFRTYHKNNTIGCNSAQISESSTIQSNNQFNKKSRNLNLKQSSSTNGGTNILKSQPLFRKQHTGKSPKPFGTPKNMFNFKMKNNTQKQSTVVNNNNPSSQSQSEQESFLSMFRTQDNKSCRPSQINNQSNFKAFDLSKNFVSSGNLGKKKNSVQGKINERSFHQFNLNKNLEQKRSRSNIRSQSRDKQIIQKKKLQTNINQQLQGLQKTIEITELKQKLLAKKAEQQLLQKSQSKKRINSKSKERLNAQANPVQQHPPSQQISTRALKVVSKLSKESLNSIIRRSRISSEIEDSVTEFDVESNKSKSIFQSPSLLIVEEITPKLNLKVQQHKNPQLNIYQSIQPSPKFKQINKILGSGQTVKQSNKKSGFQHTNTITTTNSSKNDIFNNRRMTQQVLMNSQLNFALVSSPNKQKVQTLLSGDASQQKLKHNKASGLQKTQTLIPNKQNVKTQRLLNGTISMHKQQRLFSPISHSIQQPLLNQEISKYMTKQGKKHEDIESISQQEYFNGSGINPVNSSSIQMSFDNHSITHNLKEINAFCLSANKKSNQDSFM